MVMEGDLTWGGEHTIQCADDVLWNCTPEISIILLCHPNKFNYTVKKCTILKKHGDYKHCIYNKFAERRV